MMCIVIDMNTLASVFDSGSEDHEAFKPVNTWILEGKGKLVWGGETYLKELGKTKYATIFKLLRDQGKVVKPENENQIDDLEAKLKGDLQHRDFDDAHIVALLMVSGCKLVCSKDRRAFPYFKKKDWFKKEIPKIYSGLRNKDLLCDSNIAGICQPCRKLSKQRRKVLDERMEVI